jgi:hypothetical protein
VGSAAVPGVIVHEPEMDVSAGTAERKALTKEPLPSWNRSVPPTPMLLTNSSKTRRQQRRLARRWVLSVMRHVAAPCWSETWKLAEADRVPRPKRLMEPRTMLVCSAKLAAEIWPLNAADEPKIIAEALVESAAGDVERLKAKLSESGPIITD